MATIATAETYRRQLVAALSNRDIPLAFLIGAGCAAAVSSNGKALIPPIQPLSASVCEELRKTQKVRMAALEKQFVTDDDCKPNIEILLSRVRALRDVVGTDTVRGLTSKDLDALDESISAAIVERVSVDLPIGRTPYSQFARWVTSFERRTPLEVFTTNYDLLMEQGLERAQWPFFDGFVGSVEPFFDLTSIEMDIVPTRWLRLWKVHGSVNWRMTSEGVVVRSREGKKLLIYPSHLKYAESRRMPYLAIRDRLRNFFRVTPAVLITCGYSFADQHINEDLAFGLKANRGAVCFALLFGKIENYEKARSIAANHPNLTLIAEDKAYVRSREITWGEEESMDLGDFARFADFLVTNVMGQHESHAT